MTARSGEDQIDEFIDYLRSERQLSPHTIKSYRRDLLQFQEYLDSRITISGVSSHRVRQFVAHRHRQGSSGKSLQRSLSAIRVFYHFLIRQGVVENNPALGVE